MASSPPERPLSRRLARLAAIVLIAAGAAWAGTPDFTARGTQPGLTHRLVGADEDCVACHSGNNAPENGFLPWNTWGGSMMAHAARDPVFWAALDVAERDAPGSGDWCLRCHVPKAWFEGRVRKDGIGGQVDGTDGCKLLGDHDDYDTIDSDYGGVTCHQCHRLQSPPGGQRPHNGEMALDDTASCGSEPCRRGPYRYDADDPLANQPPPHGFVGDEFVKRSEFCGTCHDVTSPEVDGAPLRRFVVDGNVTAAAFPIERTYSEWKHSSSGDRIFADGFAVTEPGGDLRRYGQTCQHCHMPQATDPAAKACLFRADGSRAGNLPVHDFVGANVFMLRVIDSLYGAALGRSEAIQQAIARARAMLQSSASVSVQLQGAGAPGTTLPATVRVTNLSGHKLPTGYGEGRRMWLEVEAFTGSEAAPVVFWRSGQYDPATGTLGDGDLAPRTYEVVQGQWNAATSTCVHTDAQSREVFHFVLNDCVVRDTRIPPAGFRGGADPELRPVGRSYAEVAPGVLSNVDVAAYSIPVPEDVTGPVRVRARLRHQVTTREYAEFLRDQAVERGIPSENDLCAADRAPLATGPRTQSRGAFFYAQWQAHDRSPPETMAEAVTVAGQ